MLESIINYFANTWHQALNADYGIMLFCIIGIATMIVLDAVTLAISKARHQTGLDPRARGISVDGSSALPGKSYLSERQALAGRPDAVIYEGGFIIPVERKPLARKVRDRYVAQLLIYMRLIEEFEGKKPPYGYLILGQNCRKVRIENTPERQAWVDSMLNEMRAILGGMPAKATPHESKCRKCDVRAHCAFAGEAVAGQKILGTATRSSAQLKQRATS